MEAMKNNIAETSNNIYVTGSLIVKATGSISTIFLLANIQILNIQYKYIGTISKISNGELYSFKTLSLIEYKIRISEAITPLDNPIFWIIDESL